jgi:hypothetical protein
MGERDSCPEEAEVSGTSQRRAKIYAATFQPLVLKHAAPLSASLAVPVNICSFSQLLRTQCCGDSSSTHLYHA